MGVTIVAASTDTLEQAQEVANTEQGLTYQMAYGVTEEDANTLGSWWSTLSAFGREQRDGYIQPTEFILSRGVVLGALYASGPVGRMGTDEIIHFINTREKLLKQDTPGSPVPRF